MAVRITVTYDGGERILEFDANRITLGRPSETEKPDADLSPDSRVSRQHAVLVVKDGGLWLTDGGSRSGTQINGREIRGQGEQRLWPEDLVQIGQSKLRIIRTGGGKPVASPAISQLAALRASAAPVTPPPPTHVHTPPPPIPVAPAANAPAGPNLQILKILDTGPKSPVADLPAGTPAEKRLALLVDLPRQFIAQTGLNGLFQTILARIVEIIPAARRGALLMRDEENDKLVLKAYVSHEEPVVSEALARRTLAERRAFIWTSGPSGDMGKRIVNLQIANGMYAPLQWQDQVFGVICVDSPRAVDRFYEDDLQFLVCIGRFAGLALAEQHLRAALGRENSKLAKAL